MSDLKARLSRRLAATRGLAPTDARHLVDEVLDLFHQTVDDFIVGRHAELQQEGFRGDAVYRRIQEELKEWRFAAPTLTVRQIRRRIYG